MSSFNFFLIAVIALIFMSGCIFTQNNVAVNKEKTSVEEVKENKLFTNVADVNGIDNVPEKTAASFDSSKCFYKDQAKKCGDSIGSCRIHGRADLICSKENGCCEPISGQPKIAVYCFSQEVSYGVFDGKEQKAVEVIATTLPKGSNEKEIIDKAFTSMSVSFTDSAKNSTCSVECRKEDWTENQVIAAGILEAKNSNNYEKLNSFFFIDSCKPVSNFDASKCRSDFGKKQKEACKTTVACRNANNGDPNWYCNNTGCCENASE